MSSGSDVEKSHSGRADQEVIVKKLCFYDDVPAAREDTGERAAVSRRPLGRWAELVVPKARGVLTPAGSCSLLPQTTIVPVRTPGWPQQGVGHQEPSTRLPASPLLPL